MIHVPVPYKRAAGKKRSLFQNGYTPPTIKQANEHKKKSPRALLLGLWFSLCYINRGLLGHVVTNMVGWACLHPPKDSNWYV